MNRIRFALFLSCLFLATMTWAQTPKKLSVVQFDAPGAGQGQNQGTIGEYIGPDGSIVGTYYDSNSVAHGYLRNPSESFTTFDPARSTATFPEGINDSQVIVGFFIDASSVVHGFVRSPGGEIARYDAPGAGTGAGQGTILGNINQSGEMAGYYADSQSVYHGFSIINGQFEQFDAPGSGNGPFQGTIPIVSEGLTNGGAIAGTYIDSNGEGHGFLRAPDGTLSEFDAVPDATNTYGFGVNSQQTVVGLFTSPERVGLGGYLRTVDGEIHALDFPVLGNPDFVTFGANSINDSGTVVGYYSNGNPQPPSLAYVLKPGGKIMFFRAPDAGTGSNQGTYPYSNNDAGQITGTYIDSNYAYHGFLAQ